jgi:hypothetical protein
MKQNIGVVDRIIRFVLSILLGILYFTKQVEGPLAVILLIVGCVLLLTSIIGTCPLYALLHIGTKPSQE